MIVLKRYRDVAAALRDPQMQIVHGAMDPTEHRRMREEARQLFSPQRFSAPQLLSPQLHAPRLFRAATVRKRASIELTRDHAEPWSLVLAAQVTGLDPQTARTLAPAAQIIFDAGASPADAIDAGRATTTLASHFPTFTALHTQAFVALAVSLPAFLGNAWLALLENRDQFDHLNEAGAIDELLRYAGPSLIQRRIKDGELVELHLAEANRDPDQYSDPNTLDLTRDATGHLAFGAGPHACVGAQLIKAAAASIMPVFAQHFRHAELIRSEPYGGPAIRGHRVYVL